MVSHFLQPMGSQPNVADRHPEVLDCVCSRLRSVGAPRAQGVVLRVTDTTDSSKASFFEPVETETLRFDRQSSWLRSDARHRWSHTIRLPRRARFTAGRSFGTARKTGGASLESDLSYQGQLLPGTAARSESSSQGVGLASSRSKRPKFFTLSGAVRTDKSIFHN